MLKKVDISLNTDNQLYNNYLYTLKKYIFLVILFLNPCLYSSLSGQEVNHTIISIEAKDSSLADIFDDIYKRYNIKLAYNSSELKTIIIDHYHAENKTIENILNDLLKNTTYSHRSIGTQIAIYKDENKNPKPNTRQITKPTTKNNTENIIRDTIYHTDTVYITKTETIYKVDTVRLHTKEVDTVIIYKKPTTKAKFKTFSSSLFAKDYSHNNQFSIRLSYSQQMSLLNLSTNTDKEEYLSLLDESIDNVSFNNISINLDGGYTLKNFDFSLGLSYNHYQHHFSFIKSEYEDEYFLTDTIDSYYIIDNMTDTIYYHIIDTTFYPGTLHQYNTDDINRLSYFGINAGISYTFFKSQRLMLYVKANAILDFIVSSNGSYIVDSKYDRVQPINKDILITTQFAYQLGLGSRIAVSKSFDLVPEVFYKHYCGSITHSDVISMKHSAIGLKLGVHYYF